MTATKARALLQTHATKSVRAEVRTLLMARIEQATIAKPVAQHRDMKPLTVTLMPRQWEDLLYLTGILDDFAECPSLIAVVAMGRGVQIWRKKG